MGRFIAERIGSLVAMLLIASFLIFGALYLAPGDPATLLAGSRATPKVLEEIREQNHLNDPVMTRYWTWLKGIAHGDLGRSFVYRTNVTALLGPRAINTVFLVVYAAVIILVLGVGLGVLGALRRRLGVVTTILTALGMATPVFVAAIVLIAIFAVGLHWFPVFGSGTGFVGRLHHLTLPAIALSLPFLAYLAQITKASVSEELGREHIETARSRGIPGSLIVRRHVFRNALIPITTVAGLTVAGLIATAVVVETAFGLDGIGSLLIKSTAQKDFTVVQAISLILVAAFVIANTIVDLLNGLLDPRLRPSK
jgi:peptide/nickel transport system permease protein